MHTFRVWAPGRRSVEVVVDGRRLRMTKGERGWWEESDSATKAGSRYGFSLDGGEVRPDPRSQSQPDGVLGLSEVVDHVAYRWDDAAWRARAIAEAVVYELHVGTFSPEGTFRGAVGRIPHLVALGVDAVELMPVAEFSGDRGWGYDGVDLFAPHHAYGGPTELKGLVDAFHAAGLAVVLDVVYNHLGPIGNFLAEFGPYFSDHHTTDWGAPLNFDGAGSDEVRRFVIDNAAMWIRDYHFDGLRLDAVHAIVDQSPVHVMEQLASEVDAIDAQDARLGRSTFLIAESDLNDPRLVLSRDSGGYGLATAWADDWHHALHSVLTGERTGYYGDFGSLELLGKALRQAWVYDGTWSAYRQKTRGRKAVGLASGNFVVATQNHDQIGNRAAGDRLAASVVDGRLKLAAALLLSSPFIPMIFQGEEWAASSPFQYFTDHSDQHVGDAVREGRRREFAAFGWDPQDIPDPQDASTYERSKLVWGELGKPRHQQMLTWHRALIDVRRRLPRAGNPLGEGVRVEVDDDSGHITFERDGVSVRGNLGTSDWRFAVPPALTLLMASSPTIELDGGDVCLPPSSVVVLLSRAANG